MEDIDRLLDMRRRAHDAGDTEGAKRFSQRITQAKAVSASGREKPSALADFGDGLKHGFDRAAYAASDLFPDAPISDETRSGWNNNSLVKGLGLTAPSRGQQQAELAAGKAISDGSFAGAAGDFIGNAAPSIAAGVATAGGALLPAALTQAGLNYATTAGDALDRTKGAVMAGTGEGVGRALPNSIAKMGQMVKPTPAAQRLIDQGVYPTPGQTLGGGFKKLEDSLTSFPGLGSAVSKGQSDALRQGNQLAMSQGGIKVPAGRDGYQQLANHFDGAFDQATKNLAFDINDNAYLTGVQSIMQKRGLDKAGIDDIERFFTNYRANTNMPAPNPNSTGLSAAGQMQPRQIVGGEDFHSMLQNLRGEGASFRKSLDPFQRRLGEAYKDIYNLTDGSLAQQGIVNPADIAAFRKVRTDYANVAPALNAGELTTVNRNQGIFSPEQYQSSLVTNAKKMGNTAAVRKGTLPQQQLADDMVEVLGGKYPDSGTAFRMAVNGGIPMGAGMVDPVTGLGLATGMAGMYGIGRGIYSNAGRKFMLGGGSGQQAVTKALRSAAPYLGTAGAATFPQFLEE